MAVTLKITVAQNVTSSSLVHIYRPFGGMRCLQLQDIGVGREWKERGINMEGVTAESGYMSKPVGVR
jgi:hypothetical protein